MAPRNQGWSDERTRQFWPEISRDRELLGQLNSELSDSPRVSAIPAFNQLIILFSQADFSTLQEAFLVASIFRTYGTRSDVLPLVTEHQGVALAGRCLVSLSLFPERMDFRRERYAAPPKDFYRVAGIKAFSNLGRTDIAENFDKWTGYVRENLFLSSPNTNDFYLNN